VTTRIAIHITSAIALVFIVESQERLQETNELALIGLVILGEEEEESVLNRGIALIAEGDLLSIAMENLLEVEDGEVLLLAIRVFVQREERCFWIHRDKSCLAIQDIRIAATESESE
jgi:hypothetical protein